MTTILQSGKTISVPETETETFRIRDGVATHSTAVKAFWRKSESFRISGTGTGRRTRDASSNTVCVPG
jgi:hypothetical protein